MVWSIDNRDYLLLLILKFTNYLLTFGKVVGIMGDKREKDYEK